MFDELISWRTEELLSDLQSLLSIELNDYWGSDTNQEDTVFPVKVLVF